MHPTILATLRADALDRIDRASKALSKQLQIDPALIDALQPQAKDPQVKELFRLQAVATLLETIAGGPSVPPALTTTGSEPTSGTDVMAVTTVTDTDTTALPPPVLEPPAEKPARKTRRSKAK